MTLAEADAWADRFWADQAALGRQLRAVVRAHLPARAERIEDRRDSIATVFGSPGAPIVSVIVSARSVLLYFHRGAALADPSGMLLGEGRRGRYLCIRRPDIARAPRVAMLLQAAAQLEEGHA